MQLPTEFYLSEKSIKKRMIFNAVFLVICFMLIFFWWLMFNSKDAFILFASSLFSIISSIMGLVYWIKRMRLPSAVQPVFKINKTCLKIGYQQEGVRLLFSDIVYAEIIENYFGRKKLKIVYNKELTYKIKQPSYMKTMFFSEVEITSWSGKWSARGLSVEPEALAQSINYHLEQYQAEAELIRNQEIYPPYD